jgi:L-asparaginase/Glu-tRNA(Gln) amidotransferase subunit D
MKKINLIQTGGTIAIDHRNKTPELGVVSTGDMTVEASDGKRSCR